MRRTDPVTGETIVLAPDGVTLVAPDGGRRFVPAPPGYRLSHFEGDTIVGQGEQAVGGWWDWHFVLEGSVLRRGDPAY